MLENTFYMHMYINKHLLFTLLGAWKEGNVNFFTLDKEGRSGFI